MCMMGPAQQNWLAMIRHSNSRDVALGEIHLFMPMDFEDFVKAALVLSLQL